MITGPAVDFGIAALAASLGEATDLSATHDNGDLAALTKLGYRTYRRAAPETQATHLAADAVRLAMRRADLQPGDIDYLIVASSALPEYLKWDLSTAVAHRAGLTDVPSLLLTQTCASAVLAFQQAAGVFATRGDTETVLLVAVNRVSEHHIDRMAGNVESDGAVAVVLRRGHPSMRWLATEQVTDASWSDFFRLEYGGSAEPVPPPGRTNRDVDPQLRVFEHFRGRPEAFRSFVRAVDTTVASAVDGAFRRAGVDRHRLSRLIYLNDNRPSVEIAAKAVGISLEATNLDLIAEYGHCGCVDPLLGLSVYLDRGELRAGDVVAVAGLAQGMHWFCTLIEM